VSASVVDAALAAKDSPAGAAVVVGPVADAVDRIVGRVATGSKTAEASGLVTGALTFV